MELLLDIRLALLDFGHNLWVRRQMVFRGVVAVEVAVVIAVLLTR